MNPSFKVRYQIVVNTHDGGFHLFERDSEWPVQPVPGMLIREMPGVPNVAGPDAGFDNVVRRVVLSGPGKAHNVDNVALTQVLVQLQGFRSPTETLEEVKAKMVGWDHVARVDDQVTETGPEDLLNG